MKRSIFPNLKKNFLVVVVSLPLLASGCGGSSSGQGDGSGMSQSPVPEASQAPTPSPTPTPFVERAQHGENISPKGNGSNEHELTIRNNSGYDAIAKLTDHKTGKIYRHVYVHQGRSLKLSGIRNGSFDLKFALGDNYSPETKTFLTSNSFTKFDSPLVFEVRYFPGGYYTDVQEVTLAKVEGGNASTSEISESEFNDGSPEGKPL